MEDGIYNAKIEGAQLMFEDHGCLILNLYTVHSGGHQAFGSVNIMNRATKTFERTGGNVAGWYIKRVFDVCEVDSFDQLVGKTIRIKEVDGIIRAIGHIIKEDWFEPRVDFTPPVEPNEKAPEPEEKAE